MKILLVSLLTAALAASFTETTRSVAIQTFQFAPDTLAAKVGDRIVWANRDQIAHTVTQGTPDEPGTAFGGVLASRGATYEITFDRPGSWTYFCDRHRFMRGAITITR
jgi:plastocyanin